MNRQPSDSIALFARANHPLGWGYPPRPGDYGPETPFTQQFGRAHGYVVIGVRCNGGREVNAVIEKFKGSGWQHPHRGDDWFNGKPGDFDHLGVIYGMVAHHGAIGGQGDNRLYVVVDAKDVLGE